MSDPVETRSRDVEGASEPATADGRLSVLKTYKLYVGGQFPRTESGRYDRFTGPGGEPLANLCRASRKDFREAVVSARAAFNGWSKRSAYNRGQILYRIAEMLEGRARQFEDELVSMGESATQARAEVAAAVDRWVYYAGWTDKVQQVFSSVNPVASSHFNFTILEPTGVVGVFAPASSGLLGLTSVVAPILAGGNTCVVLASETRPLSAITLGEVLHSSDVPGGVVNLLTGHRDELLEHFASHRDVNAFLLCADGDATAGEALAEAQRLGADNVKRVIVERGTEWRSSEHESPYRILDFLEAKTTWHPIGS